MTRGSRHFPVRRYSGAIVLVVIVSGLAFPPVGGLDAAMARTPLGPLGHSPHGAPAVPVGGGAHPAALRAVRSLAASHEFYTQIGATLSQVNRSSSVKQLAVLDETISVVNSPYPTAYELNLVSGTGDWYQIVIADNWPSCNGGFEEATEIWNDQGAGQSLFCDPTVVISAGDQVTLNGSLPTRSIACLGLDDLTSRVAHTVCFNQPDGGAIGFELLSTAANNNGYNTGTMTEVVNLTASACPDYRGLPRVTYAFPSWVEVSQYVPWSDEFDLLTGSYCDGYSTTPVYLPPGDPASQFLDATAGAADGPQLVEGQNDTPLVNTVGFRFQSNPVAMTSETVTAAHAVVSPGGTDLLRSTTTGGLSPYTTRWSLDGQLNGLRSSTWNFTTAYPGNYTVVAYGIDAQGDVLASSPLTILVPSPLKAAPPSIAPGPHVDVGQAVTFYAQTSGGVPPLTFQWTGLPSGCPAQNASSIACTPTAPGATTVHVSVVQGNGSTASPPGLAVVIDPALTITIRSTTTMGDVGQQAEFFSTAAGGSGGYTFSWYNLPGACVGSAGQQVCTLNTSGEFVVNVAVNDTNANTVGSTAIPFDVSPALAATFEVVPSIVDLGGSVSLQATVTGGSGGLHFAWGGLPSACAVSDAATLGCVPSVTGASSVTLTVKDLANVTVPIPARPLQVFPDLAVALSPNATLLSAPGEVTLTPAETSGSPIANLTWLGLPSGCPPGTGLARVHCTGLAPGGYTVVIEVADEGGGSARASATFTVGPAPTVSNPPPAPIGVGTYLVIGLAALVAMAVGIAWSRRRRPPTGIEGPSEIWGTEPIVSR